MTERTKLADKLPRPATRRGRTILGVLLILGGLVGFLPVVGFWMIPLGLIVLSQDFPTVRRFRRKWTVKLSRWWHVVRGKMRKTLRW